jgi:hypothetical protein
MKIWGYWATLGWSILALLAGQFVGFGGLLWLRRGDWDSLLLTSFDGALVTIFIVLSNPIVIGVLAIAARIARANLTEYFALKLPSPRSGGGLASRDAGSRYHHRAGRRRGNVSRVFVPRLGAFAAFRLARDRRDLDTLGNPAHPV